MKSIYIAVAVAVVLVAGSVASSIYVKNVAEELEKRTEAVFQEIEQDNYAGAIEATEQLERQIERSKTLLCAVVDHKDIYEIKRSVGELMCYLDKEEKPDSLAHCAAIVAVTEKISDNSLLCIYNIL